MMKVSNPLPKILFTVALLAQAAGAAPKATYTLSGGCDTVFYATSTLKDFSGTVTNTISTGSAIVVDGEESWTFVAETATGEMTTNHKKRDKSMRKMFEVVTFPSISCKVDQASLADMKPSGKQSGTIPLDLTIREVEKRINGEVTNWQEEGQEISFDCAFDVSLKSFELKPHSLLGVLRVGDKVHVVVNVKLLRRLVAKEGGTHD
jgi:hypothetical protein